MSVSAPRATVKAALTTVPRAARARSPAVGQGTSADDDWEDDEAWEPGA